LGTTIDVKGARRHLGWSVVLPGVHCVVPWEILCECMESVLCHFCSSDGHGAGGVELTPLNELTNRLTILVISDFEGVLCVVPCEILSHVCVCVCEGCAVRGAR